MKKKKAVHVSLAAVIAAGALAGCGGGEQAATSKEPPAAQKAKFSISYPTTVNTGYHARIPDLNKDKWVLKLEELTNTDLDVRVMEETKMSVMFAGGDLPDVVGNIGTPTNKAMSGSVEAGMFMPLDDLLKQHAPNLMKAVPKAAWEAVSYKGKIYGIPEYLANPSRRATFIRTDLLKQTGLPAPKTVDEFLNVLRAFKKLGVENPYQMRENFKYADVILGAFDVLPYKDQFEVKDGQVVPKFFDADNMMKALQVYKTMYDEGLIPKDFATITSTDYTKNINGGKAGSWSSNATGLVGFRVNNKQVVPDSQVDIIASPKGPEGTGGYFYYTPVIRSFYINAKVKPETAVGIIKFFDWMVTPEAEKFFTFGIEGDTYTTENGAIKYKFPQTKEETEEEGFRSGTLWAAHDATYNKMRLELDQNGKDTLKAFDEVLAKEGLGGIGFYPDLTAFTKFPDLAAPQQDVGPKLIIDHMIKMIYGKEPISDWPKVIEEYKSKGGNEIIKEATDRYNKKEGVMILSK
ncbi:extracellular solute-binding protein [Paenibacillus sp. GD4]|jgi:putative aldouronate transport system substrate-binding protein|uniref:extracellular solute-binding protein n=1 Tax=Paenibacillus sp. GD4 TaxID=3068890 RepID=UPI002796BC1A|nr:extracellular solute-binding protein [Paenibacillus sp. GD4]MDQ1912585.1 extracellular solute-binding protein [Paenibacillus sp. GD4]